jgi:hypothetical protein
VAQVVECLPANTRPRVQTLVLVKKKKKKRVSMIKHFLREFSYVFWTSEVVIPSFDAGTFFVLPEGVSNDTFMTATCPTADCHSWI